MATKKLAKPVKKSVKRYDDGGTAMQTPEEAANEAALNADLPRRRMMDAAMAEGYRDEKALPAMAAAAEAAAMEAVPARKRAPMVTKEELARSGLSLRDYMNQQLGLTRRGGMRRPNADYGNEGRRIAPMNADYGNEGRSAAPMNANYGNEGRYSTKPIVKYETPYDRMNRQNRERGLAKGGKVSSASSRGDGIAKRGKTKGRMV
jgi:hypothetical protein